MMECQQSGWLLSIFLDVFSCFIVYLPWIILQFVEPFHRGFNCNDESLGHPYKDSTVPSAVMIPLGLTIPPIIFIITELVIMYLNKLKGIPPGKKQLGRFAVPVFAIDCYHIVLVYMFGAALQQTFTAIGKRSIGRLRPHFFDICQPDYSKFNCTDSRGIYLYIDSADACGTTNLSKLRDARLSFPSGHASFSTYCTVFVAIYLQARMRWSGSKLLRPFSQAAVLYLGVLCSLSRISDYKHHWSDVLAGAVLGTGIALVMTLYVSDLFPTVKKQEVLTQVTELTSLLPSPNQNQNHLQNHLNAGNYGMQEQQVITIDGPADISTVFVDQEQNKQHNY